MSEANILVTSGFRRASLKAADWLVRSTFDSLFLNLPEDFESFIRAYARKSIGRRTLWKAYGYMTGTQEPYVKALADRFEPILELLPDLVDRYPSLELYCYHDLAYHVRLDKIAEKFLMLEYRERVGKHIKIDEWRKLLAEDLECSSQLARNSVEYISERLSSSKEAAILCGGLTRYLRRFLELRLTSRSVYLDTYWRPPLQVLQTLASVHGLPSISDESLESFVKDHFTYLDYVITSKDVDEAHSAWSRDSKPFRLEQSFSYSEKSTRERLLKETV